MRDAQDNPGPSADRGRETPLRSQSEDSLSYPIRIVDAEPYLRPGTDMGTEGTFTAVHRQLGTASAERVRLPVPGSTWRLDGKVGRTADGTVYAGFGTYLYSSRDEGRNWTGRLLDTLPHTRGERAACLAFGAAGSYIFVAHRASALPPAGVYEEANPADARRDRNIYPIVVSRSQDGGRTWEAGAALDHPIYRYLAGDGNSLIELEDGPLLLALDGRDPTKTPGETGQIAQILFRSSDRGKTWGDPSLIEDRAAETGLLGLGGSRVLAAMRGIPNSRVGGKTIELASSEDGGRTWNNIRPLTRAFGQAHCDLASLPGGGVLAVYENRYPYRSGGDVRARISRDGGDTWEPELYVLSVGHGYAGSVASDGETIITVMGDAKLDEKGNPTADGFTLQAMRWKPQGGTA